MAKTRCKARSQEYKHLKPRLPGDRGQAHKGGFGVASTGNLGHIQDAVYTHVHVSQALIHM